MSTIIPEGEIFTCLFNLGGYFKKWYKKSGKKKHVILRIVMTEGGEKLFL